MASQTKASNCIKSCDPICIAAIAMRERASASNSKGYILLVSIKSTSVELPEVAAVAVSVAFTRSMIFCLRPEKVHLHLIVDRIRWLCMIF